MPENFSGPNLATELTARGLSFAGYSEGLPAAGYRGCSVGRYARKHDPWVGYPALPTSVNQPFSAFPATHHTRLPTVSFVVPDLGHDMHDGTVAAGDRWLRTNLSGYASWALHNNSLPTVLYGARLPSGADRSLVTHYTILRTIEAAYGLPALGSSARTRPLSYDWQA